MENFLLGIKSLFRIWGDTAFAREVKDLIDGRPPVAAPTPAVVETKPPARSEALTLLSVLQREARLVDFVKEPIAGYTDAQIGAAVRTVHNDCGAVLDRLFAIEPLRSESEGAEIAVASGYDPAQFRLVGNVAGSGRFAADFSTPAGEAAKSEMPEWNGREESALVVAPCEVELK